jgi:hypothetical protein
LVCFGSGVGRHNPDGVRGQGSGRHDNLLTGTGVKGTLAATAVKTGAGTVTAGAAPELAKLVNAALAAG